MALNSRNRAEFVDFASKTTFDLLIIGGGITGAGIALDAASRGLKTILLEKNDFAFGTSSRSTKLIHGGLRYLKQFRFKEVAEVGHERKILFKNAPHVVFPEKMLLPIYEKGTFGKWSTSLGLLIYDWLAGVNRNEKRKMLGVKETLQAEPLLNKKGLLGSGLYYEYRTEDYRLVIDILKKASLYGATCINYCAVRKFNLQNDTISGVVAKDSFTGQEISIHAKVVVNATGPWADTLTRLDNRKQKKILLHTKGVHLVFDRQDLPLKQSVYFDTNDNRMVFAIPKDNHTYVGTTDTLFTENLEQPKVHISDVDYLLGAISTAFPDIRLDKKNIRSSWAGIRPLIQEEGKSPSEISRKDEILISPHGLISIAGGKLTGYRKMAEKICDIVVKNPAFSKHSTIKSCQTQNISLQTEEPFTIHDLMYCIEHEGVQTLSDFFIRRTGMLYFEPHKIIPLIDEYADAMQHIFNWTHQTKMENISILQDEIKACTEFKK